MQEEKLENKSDDGETKGEACATTTLKLNSQEAR